MAKFLRACPNSLGAATSDTSINAAELKHYLFIFITLFPSSELNYMGERRRWISDPGTWCLISAPSDLRFNLVPVREHEERHSIFLKKQISPLYHLPAPAALGFRTMVIFCRSLPSSSHKQILLAWTFKQDKRDDWHQNMSSLLLFYL